MSVRDDLAATMRASLADQAAHRSWDYRAIRPLPLYGKRGAGYPPGDKDSDCSWGVRLNCWWTKEAPDPMGSNFVGPGNSSTMCLRLTHLNHPSELLVGDIVTVGFGGYEHACQVLEAGDDPLVWSDGHQGAPDTYRLSWDRRWPKQYLRLPVPAPPKTPKEKLRAKTGYWAWMQWTFGEGAWKKYKPSDKTVRPTVPRLIPPKWWKARLRYYLARKRGNKSTTKEQK